MSSIKNFACKHTWQVLYFWAENQTKPKFYKPNLMTQFYAVSNSVQPQTAAHQCTDQSIFWAEAPLSHAATQK